jgi:tetratricopeptide (TPR) repeat protein
LDLEQFLEENLVYPDRGKYHCESLNLYVNFVVNKDGTIEKIRANYPDAYPKAYTEEAVRLMAMTQGQWIPGRVNNKPVASKHSVNISFYNPDYDCLTLNSHYSCGRKNYEERAFAEAKAEFEKGFAINPYDQDVLFALGVCEVYLGNAAQACGYWSQMIDGYNHEVFASLKAKYCGSEENQYSCLPQAEETLVAEVKELFLERMREYYPDSMQHPFQTFLRQYGDIEIDNAFFRLDQEQRRRFQEGLPWKEYVEPEMDQEFVIEPPAGAKNYNEARKRKLAERGYPEENRYLDMTSKFTRCM